MDMGRTLSQIPSTVPVLLFHGTDDELIPLDDAKSYKAARPSIELQVIEGARHAFRGKKPLKLLLNTAVSFIQREHHKFYGHHSA
jgi:alpha-beta hydrolase superfamily lysophospholipase